MENKSRKRKRNKGDRGKPKGYAWRYEKWFDVNDELDYKDRNLLPREGSWGQIMSPVTGIVYRVKIAKIKRVR